MVAKSNQLAASEEGLMVGEADLSRFTTRCGGGSEAPTQAALNTENTVLALPAPGMQEELMPSQADQPQYICLLFLTTFIAFLSLKQQIEL